jgi:hypothetical protein
MIQRPPIMAAFVFQGAASKSDIRTLDKEEGHHQVAFFNVLDESIA